MTELEPELVNSVAWMIPNALTIIGSRAGEQRNAMTASWVTQVAMDPVLIGVSVQWDAVTTRLIREGGSFTVNLWDAADAGAMARFAKPADVIDGAIKGRPVRDAPGGAPVFDEAVAWLDCRVRHTFDLGSHILFVGELTALDQRVPDAEVASMAHTRMKYGGVPRKGMSRRP